jgi:hypothetical protein
VATDAARACSGVIPVQALSARIMMKYNPFDYVPKYQKKSFFEA